MKPTLANLLFSFSFAFFPNLSKGQVILYQWLNQPCDQNLNCATGCSACNLPAAGDGLFIGTNVVWSGIDVCPHPIVEGDNVVLTSNWPIAPATLTFVGLSGIALEPMQVDSIIVRHRRSADGPQRLRMEYTNNVASLPETIGDVDVTEQFQESVFTDLGCLPISENSPYGGFQVRMRAYQGGAGNWQLDELRIVASPCQSITVGISENFQRVLSESSTYVDVLGRPVLGQPGPGVYIGARKRVQIF